MGDDVKRVTQLIWREHGPTSHVAYYSNDGEYRLRVNQYTPPPMRQVKYVALVEWLDGDEDHIGEFNNMVDAQNALVDWYKKSKETP